MRLTRCFALAVGTAALVGAGLTATMPALASPQHHRTFLGMFHRTKLVASTVPRNGDLNPYGVALVRHSQGRLHQDSVLVSNFNNSKNLQGTGSTIVEISPNGHRIQFAHITKRGLPGACPGGIGLTTALVILRDWVFVGSTPSRNGQAGTAKAGCVLVLNSRGHVVETISGHGINGPWDATGLVNGPHASLFVANVLNGTVNGNGRIVRRGTVLRIGLRFIPGHLPLVVSRTVVGSGFAQRTDPAAFVVGPTGLGLGLHGSLFVADTASNRITMIDHVFTKRHPNGTGRVLTSGGFLNGPLGLAVASNGSVLTVNAGDGRVVETRIANGRQVASRFIDRSGSPPGNGALFGLGIAPHDSGVYYVDDAANTLRLLF